jgi:hypothetical protein
MSNFMVGIQLDGKWVSAENCDQFKIYIFQRVGTNLVKSTAVLGEKWHNGSLSVSAVDIAEKEKGLEKVHGLFPFGGKHRFEFKNLSDPNFGAENTTERPEG